MKYLLYQEYYSSCLKKNPLHIYIFVNSTTLWHLWSSASEKLSVFFSLVRIKIKAEDCEKHDCQPGLLHWSSSRKKEVLLMRSMTERGQPHHFHDRERYYKRSIFYLFSQSLPESFNRNLIKCHHLEIMLLSYIEFPLP